MIAGNKFATAVPDVQLIIEGIFLNFEIPSAVNAHDLASNRLYHSNLLLRLRAMEAFLAPGLMQASLHPKSNRVSVIIWLIF